MKQIHSLSRDGPIHYEIIVQGCLDETWSAWFENLAIHCRGDGSTIIAGPITDQPALHGILKKIRDLGVDLVSVRQRNPEQGEVQ